jgi:hypothetical protein
VTVITCCLRYADRLWRNQRCMRTKAFVYEVCVLTDNKRYQRQTSELNTGLDGPRPTMAIKAGTERSTSPPSERLKKLLASASCPVFENIETRKVQNCASYSTLARLQHRESARLSCFSSYRLHQFSPKSTYTPLSSNAPFSTASAVHNFLATFDSMEESPRTECHRVMFSCSSAFRL